MVSFAIGAPLPLIFAIASVFPRAKFTINPKNLKTETNVETVVCKWATSVAGNRANTKKAPSSTKVMSTTVVDELEVALGVLRALQGGKVEL